MDSLQIELDSAGVLTLTLNRPDQLNALNRSLLHALEESLLRAEQDSQVNGILITGSGHVFCAGADIRELAACDALSGYAFAQYGQQVFRRFEQLRKPSIALINGIAVGGGCELIQATTLRVASNQSKFGQPEVKLGVIPAYGGSQRLARLIGKGRALDLCLTGRMIDAATAHSWGLVSVVCETEKLMETGRTLLLDILDRAPLAIAAVMEVIDKGYDLPIDAALAFEAFYFAQTCASADKHEGVQAFLQKRTAQFKGK